MLFSSTEIFSWTQAAPDNMLSVRAVLVDETVCPEVNVDGEKFKMFPRNNKITHDMTHPLACEIQVPRTSKNIKIADLQLPTLKKEIKKIAVIGDTGCRVSYLQQQNCSSSDEWPLVRNINSIVAHSPDLVIHVGDLLYRQGRCRDKQKCGSEFGYNWSSWNADWFTPVSNLFAASPLLFVRGNHESCTRAYQGWFDYFDPYPIPEEGCTNFSNSWFFDTGKSLKLFVFDSSFGSDSESSDYHIDNLRLQFAKLFNIERSDETKIGLLTHRPLWNYASFTYSGGINAPQIEAFGSNIPDYVSFILSGHIHLAQILEIEQRPLQIIAGNGGALLSTSRKPQHAESINIDKMTVNQVDSFQTFGFAIIDLNDSTVSFYDMENSILHKHHFS